MNRYALIAAVVLGVITGGLGLKALSGSSSTEIEMKVPGGGSLRLDAKKDFRDPQTVLSALFAQESSRQASIAWLKSKKKIFSLGDPGLVDALLGLCPEQPDNDRNETIFSRQARLQKCLEQPVVRRLRYIASHHEGPFQYIGEKVRIGVPRIQRDQPKDGYANVCRGGDLLESTIELTDPRTRKSIVVRATGSYICTHFDNYPDVQLDVHDSARLFGRPTMEYEDAIAVVVSQ